MVPKLCYALCALLGLSGAQGATAAESSITRWSEERVERVVNQVRAGRDLNPDAWPGGARVAALLSTDCEIPRGSRGVGCAL